MDPAIGTAFALILGGIAIFITLYVMIAMCCCRNQERARVEYMPI